MLRRVTRFGAVGVLCTLLTAGCDSIVEPPAGKMSPPASSQTPTSTTSAEAAPVMPEEAKQATPAGAEAFIRYYVEALNYSYRNNDASVVSRLSAPGCTACKSHREGAEKRRSQEQRLTGSTIVIDSLTPLPAKGDEFWFTMDWRQLAGDLIDKNGTTVKSYRETTPAKIDLVLKYDQSSWVMVEFGTHDAN